MSDDLKARLAAAQAKKAEAEAKRAALTVQRSPLEEVELAEIEAANEAAIAAAEEEHGPIGKVLGTVSTAGGVIIVKRPVAVFFQSITKGITSKNDQKAEEAARRLIDHCRVYPSKEQYEKLVETYPAVPGYVIELIGKLAAGGASITGE